jgi:predicted DNA-binding transcriptional regulator YafY
MPEKYVRCIVEIIYQDGKGRITQRRISVRAVVSGKVYAFDVNKREPRVFVADRILAVAPV